MVKREYGKQEAGRGLWICVFLAATLIATTIGWEKADAGTLEATPKLIIKYRANDNIYANDSDELAKNEDLISATYLDYLVGIALSYREGRNLFQVSGDAGFEQYLTISGLPKNAPDDKPNNYNYVTINLGVLYRYAGSKTQFELHDNIMQSRDLQSVFGAATDAIGYWSLYTHNVAGVAFRFSPSKKTRFLTQYNYDTLTFATPENDVGKPADSTEHRGFFRTEYSFSDKTTGLFDLQGAQREFEDTEDDVFAVSTKAADYNLIQVMIGLRYSVNNHTHLEALGGYAQRNFYNLSDRQLASPPWPAAYNGMEMFELENMNDPVGRITFLTQQGDRYMIKLEAVQGVSTYGQNLFFNYSTAQAELVYHFDPKIYVDVQAQYRQSLYDVEKNGREWIWDSDRTDNTTYASALVHWDILQKGGQGTLAVEAGYSYQDRRSSIEDMGDYNIDYVNLFPVGTPFNSYSAVINAYYFKVQVLPTVLFGK